MGLDKLGVEIESFAIAGDGPFRSPWSFSALSRLLWAGAYLGSRSRAFL
jgi:hypothetical protein